MKRIKLLAIIPALVICACDSNGNGKNIKLDQSTITPSGTVRKISEDEAAPAVKEIKRAKYFDEIADINIVHTYNRGRGKDKISTVMKFRLMRNFETNETYFRQDGVLSYSTVGENYSEGYEVRNKDGEIKEYLRYREHKNEKLTYGEYDEDSSSLFMALYYKCYSSAYELYDYAQLIDNYTSKVDSQETCELYSNDDDYFKYYYGYGEDGKAPVDETEEIEYYKRYTGEYINNKLVRFYAVWKTNWGNESEALITISYDNPEIKLPSNWKKAPLA